MAAFDTAKVERALREPLGDEAAREVTEALAEGMSEHLATRESVDRLGTELRAEIASPRFGPNWAPRYVKPSSAS